MFRGLARFVVGEAYLLINLAVFFGLLGHALNLDKSEVQSAPATVYLLASQLRNPALFLTLLFREHRDGLDFYQHFGIRELHTHDESAWRRMGKILSATFAVLVRSPWVGNINGGFNDI
jgi:hypothetical protein